MADDNNEGWIKEGESYTAEKPQENIAEKQDWVTENSELSNSLVNPGKGFLTGAASGAASKIVNPVSKMVIGTGNPAPGTKPSIFRVQPHEHPVQKWTGKMHVGDVGAAKDARDFKEANRMMMEAKEAERKAQTLAKANALFGKVPPPPPKTPISEKVGDVIRGTSKAFTPEAEGMVGKVMTNLGQTAGRALSGGAATYQGYDAYNRFKQGDPVGGVISSVGALGSGSAMIPTPATRVIGTGVGMSAEIINYLRDHPEEAAKLLPQLGGGNIQTQENPITAVSPVPVPKMAGGGRLGSGGDQLFGANGPHQFGTRDVPDYRQEIPPRKMATGGDVKKKKSHGPITKEELALIHRLREGGQI
jgi:hypothetical protein